MVEGPKKLSELQDQQKNKSKKYKEKKVGKALTAKQQPSSMPSKTKNQPKRTITSIEKQKRPGRYNIYIDGDYAFPLDEQVLIDYMLNKGKAISKELEKELKEADHWQKAYHLALDYISYQLRSEKEVRDRLQKESVSESVIEGIIHKLEDLQLLDDLTFAQSFVRTKAGINQYGPQQIRQKLFQKGIAESLIEQAMEEYQPSERLDNAIYWAEKQAKKKKNNSSRQAEQKIRQYLMQKGFGADTIAQALAQIDIEKSEEEEYEAIVKQGNKAWRRYSKFSLEECKQKTLRNLYSKAFPIDLIQAFIDEKESEWHEEENEFN